MLKILHSPLRILPTIRQSIWLPSKYMSTVPIEVNTNQLPEPDTLYSTIEIQCRGHDRAVLNSYEWFTKTAADHLNINITKVEEPKENRKRRTLLKSAFVHKKHRVQYEFRTYYRFFTIKHITGSTADTYLEYLQRNLPEGVAMKVIKERIEKLPEHIANYVPENRLADK